MAGFLLKTKFSFPPRQARWVRRSRLLELLDAGLFGDGGFARKLTLVSAPAGYGKTTLVTDWLTDSGVAFAWLSLDENDNDPVIFLSYLLAAFRTVQPGFGEQLESILNSPQPPPPLVLQTALVNEIASCSQTVILVLDDYHLIHSTQIHQHLAFLLDHQPAGFHLVLATRVDPLLPLARLRARGQMLEIRQADLRFTPEESAEFFDRATHLDLTADQVDVLDRRTEGWIAGLQLAALSLQGRQDASQFVRDFAGSNRFILDYLIDEVFLWQSPEVKDFLLKTSILDQLCASLCDEVLQDDRVNSQDVLQALEGANLFVIALDQNRDWYRYHHLFSDLLRYRLREVQDPPEAVLHQRASQWYESRGLFPESIQHALAAADWGRAVGLLVQVNERMFKHGEVVALLNWLAKLPDPLVRSHPQLCLMMSWAFLLTGQFDQADTFLISAVQLVPPDSPFAGDIAAAQAYSARSRGEMGKAIELSEKALALLPETNYSARSSITMNLGIAYWHMGRMDDAQLVLDQTLDAAQKSGNIYSLLTAQVFLARVAAVRGELHRAAAAFQEIIRQGGRIPILALAHFDLCTIYYEWNDLPQAYAHLDQGLALSLDTQNIEFVSSGYLLRAYLKFAQGDFPAMLESVDQSYALVKENPLSTRSRTFAMYARASLAMSDLERAAYWVDQLTVDVDTHPFCRFLCLTRPRLLIAQGKREAAAVLLEPAVQQARQAGLTIGLLVALLLQAQSAASSEAALQIVAEVVKVAQPEGYLRIFLDEGQPVRVLLSGLKTAGKQARFGFTPAQSAYLDILLDAFPAIPPASQPPVAAALRNRQAGLVEPLSERELQVLDLLAAGLSNRQIAAKLIVSLGTAKTHIHNIYGKLDVQNRAQAIARARELELI
jgi:LuxR family maltose regulon positive regulatory protein